MSALHCPTRVFLARHGEAGAGDLGRALRGERIARVWSSPEPRALRTAETAAAVLGVDVVVLDDERGGADLLAGVLREVADQHRGEAVLVVCHGEAVLPGPAGPSGRSGPVALEVDEEGWRVVAWDGSRS